MRDFSLAHLMGFKEQVKDSTQVIDSFSFDKEIYREIYEQSPAIQQTVAEGDAILRTFSDLAQDLYMALYKHRPQLLGVEDVKDTHRFNHQLMQEIMEMEEFRQLRKKTRLDMIASALGMEVMSKEAVVIVKRYEEMMKEQNGGQSPFEGINQQIDQNGYGSNPAPGAGSGQPQNQQGQGSSSGGSMTAEQAKEYLNQQQQGQGQDPNNPSNQGQGNGTPQPPIDPKLFNDMLSELQQAVQKALDDVSDVRDFLQAWGMEEGNGANRITYEHKKRALQRLRKSRKIKELTELVGRMKKLAINEQKQKAPEGAEAIKSVVTGNDIVAVLPSEKAQLASKNKNLRRNFYRKYYQKELLQYDMDVYKSMGRGPMIVCVDTSGSMGGERENWSKAVALALLEIATNQKRNFACLHYDSRVQHVWEIPYGELKPDDVFDIAEYFSGGKR